MFDECPASIDEDVAGVDRRGVLKSAGALLAASAAGLATATTVRAAAEAQTAGVNRRGSDQSASLHKGMMSFMLAHEQFPVPELVRLGAYAEQAGFDMSGGLSFDVAGDRGQGRQAPQNQDNNSGQAFQGRAFQQALATAGQADQSAASGALNLRRSLLSGVDIRI